MTNAALLASLFGFEAGLLGVLLGWDRRGGLPLAAFLGTRTGIGTALAGALALVSAAAIGRAYVRSRRGTGREFRLTVAMNLLTVTLVAGVAEIAARVLTRRVRDTAVLLGMELRPRNWRWTVERHRDVLSRAGGQLTYMVYDRDLGWSLGASRASADSMYFSSAEGIRAPAPGVAYAREPARPRIVLVGDSHTFGYEVRFADTWGSALERELNGAYQVINLGVPSYGTDQAYLRYERDAKSWQPRVVVFGVVAHDVVRAMSVYTFLDFPDWELPFTKPRFVLGDSGLRVLNVPTLPPESVVAAADVTRLPFLEYDPGYRPEDWSWRPLDVLYLERLFRVWPRRYRPQHPYGTERAALALNEAILRAFIASARAAHSRPLLVLLPGPYAFDYPNQRSLNRDLLERSGLPFVDLLPCLQAVPAHERFAPRGHYAPAANAAVARCLAPKIRQVLSGPG